MVACKVVSSFFLASFPASHSPLFYLLFLFLPSFFLFFFSCVVFSFLPINFCKPDSIFEVLGAEKKKQAHWD
jgi:hypothetical protein